MVCVPCFIIPVLLFVWRLLQPYIQRFWNPIDQNKDQTAAPVGTEDNTNEQNNQSLKLPFGITCPTCPMRGPCPKLEDSNTVGDKVQAEVEVKEAVDKKED